MEGTRDTAESDGSMRCQDSYCSRTDFRDSRRKNLSFPNSAIVSLSAVLSIKVHHTE